MYAYSFLSVLASIAGPGGAINLANGAGSSDEGIEIEPLEDVGTMVTGADGSVMHSLHGARPGTVRVTLLKNSDTNALLMTMFNFQTASPSAYGQNTISVVQKDAGDVITCQQVAFKKAPRVSYSKAGEVNVWEFNVGRLDISLGAGVIG